MTASPSTGRIDARMRVALVSVAAFGGLFAIGGAYGWGVRAGFSVAVGTCIAMANLYGLARIVGALVGTRAEGDPSSGMWGALAIVKVLALFGGVWILMSTGVVDVIPLVVGWGALPIGIAAGSLSSDKSDRSSEPHAKEAPPGEPPQA